MSSSQVAHVALETATYQFDKLYDYAVPQALQASLRPGCRVIVPFGRGDRWQQGMVFGLSEGSRQPALKDVYCVLDQTPVLNAEQRGLVQWMKERAFCTYFDAIRCLLPAGLHLKQIVAYVLDAQRAAEAAPSLNDTQRAIVSALAARGKPIRHQTLLKQFGLAHDAGVLQELLDRRVLQPSGEIAQRAKDATLCMVRLCADAQTQKLTPKQQSVVSLLESTGAAGIKEICYFTGVTAAVVRALVQKGVAETFELPVYRRPYQAQAGRAENIRLTEQQQLAYQTLRALAAEGKPRTALLCGVTGSGKTQVFLKLSDDVLSRGKSVIVMVPEIALTPQTLSIFHGRYGDQVAVFHSAMSIGQRMDEFKRVRDGSARIAVGTRSAVFAPFEDLGLVIIDEEQEHTYKSEQSPRFHARDVARFRCGRQNALLLLASATPSLESYSAAQKGRYTLCTLEKRYGNAVLPEVVTVDMRAELLAGNTSPISRTLSQALEETLAQGRQSILLLNRRGHNTFISCPSCGAVVTCPNCSISMTYHSANHRLMCHYCGRSEPYAQVCPRCGGEHMRYMGVGTQHVEAALQSLFPQANVLRMDADNAMTRLAFESKMGDFSQGKYDIMLGTQMVAKGLDFPNVTLVGVIDADRSMYSDDFRSFERTFALLTQVVGRAGRGDVHGKAIVQTIDPNSEVIRLACAQDYTQFFQSEIKTRKMMIYPPFCDMVMVGLIGPDRAALSLAAQAVFEQIKSLLTNDYADVRVIILGPADASIPKVGGRYRKRLLIKCKNNARLRDMLRQMLLWFGRTRFCKDVSIFLDVNPDHIM